MRKKNKPHEIIRAFKLIIKNLKNNKGGVKGGRVLECMFYERIVNYLIDEAAGEPLGLMKYFEDFLPSSDIDYFRFLYDVYSPVRNIIDGTFE